MPRGEEEPLAATSSSGKSPGGIVWRNRFRLAAALAVSLAAHAWLAGGLARMPLRVVGSGPVDADDAPRERPPPRDFPIAVADRPPAAAAHEAPLDSPIGTALTPPRAVPRGGEAATIADVVAPLPVVRDIGVASAGLPPGLAPRLSVRPAPAPAFAPSGAAPARPAPRVDGVPGRVVEPPSFAAPSNAPGPAAGGLASLGIRPAPRQQRPVPPAAAATTPAAVAVDEPLSVTAPPAVVLAGRGTAVAPDLPFGPAAAAARGTPTVLPPEGRVRSVARPFAGRAVERRVPTPVDGTIERGLAFLARGQRADGSWSLDGTAAIDPRGATKLRSDTAATGLALLAFLGAGHDHFDGPHRDSVRRGLEWLMRAQAEDGDLYQPSDPLSDSCAWMYSHAIGAMALCEAVGMTGDPLVRPAAEKACRFIAASQHPERGGWRYTPRSDADLSVSGWMLIALRSGQLAGITVDPAVVARVRTLLDASAAADAAGDIATTRFIYNVRDPQQRPSSLSTACMTALGTLMRLHTGTPVDDPTVARAARALAGFEPGYGTPGDRRRDAYFWYYASQVLVHTGGPDWERWYAALCRLLEGRQERSGPLAGSWDPLGPVPDRWGGYGGRVYVTALHLLALEVPARHLPTSAIGPAAPPPPGDAP